MTQNDKPFFVGQMTQSDEKVFDRNVELSTNCNGSWQALIKLTKGPTLSFAASPRQKTNIAKAEAKDGLQRLVSRMLAENPEWSL